MGRDPPNVVDIESLSRRELLGVGAGAAAALAGCGGNPNGPTPIPDQNGGGGDGGDGDVSTVDASDENTVVSRVAWQFAVGDSQWNRWAAASNTIPQRGAFHTNVVSFDPRTNQYFYEIADGPPTMDGCVLHQELKEGFTWWDGTEVTAKDRAIPHRLIPYFCCGGPDEVPWVSEFVSKYEYKENKIGKLSQTFAATNMIGQLPGKAAVWEPYIERLEDATTDDETQNILKEIRDRDITIDDAIELGLGNGLWKPVDYTTSELVLEKHEAHPYADRTDIERWVWKVASTDQSFTQAFKQGRYDFGTSAFTNVQNPPENIETVVSYPSRYGRKLGMNWRNKHLARLPVRRAINYLLDLNDLATVVDDVSPLTQQTAGTPDSFAEEWLGEEFLDNIIDYGPEGKPEKAAQTMREAGYEKRGGVWTDEDGDKMQGLRFISPSSSNAALLGDTIGGILSDFGIETEFSSLEGGSYADVTSQRTGSGDFDLAIHNVGVNLPHPARVWGYRPNAVVAAFAQAANQEPAEECGTDPPQVTWNDEKTPIFSIPVNPIPAFPEKVGKETLEGEGQTFDPIQHSTQMRFDVGEDKIKELARTYAWWVNFNAFHVYLHTQNRKYWMDTDKLSVADEMQIRGATKGSGPMGHGYVSMR
jgi:peptide/nickel transport system substrate-binding protein